MKLTQLIRETFREWLIQRLLLCVMTLIDHEHNQDDSDLLLAIHNWCQAKVNEIPRNDRIKAERKMRGSK